LLCLAAIITGCGETSKTKTEASAPASQSTTTADPAATTEPGTTSTAATAAGGKPQATTTTAARHGRSALAKARARAAFESLAHAKPAPKLTPTQQAERPIADIQLTSPALQKTKIPAENTCHGANNSPALHWANIPPGTAELAIFLLSAKPANNHLVYDWAITHINPSLNELKTGQTPPEAITGRNSQGTTTYNICPPTNKPETYILALYALPTKLPATPGYNPTTLRTQAKHTTHHIGTIITTNTP
jgi:phosphatidylethanolamine-binding protein (PEBP) family uncharacterized protein